MRNQNLSVKKDNVSLRNLKYELYFRKYNVFLHHRNWIKFHFRDKHIHIKITIDPILLELRFHLVNTEQSTIQEIDRCNCNKCNNLELCVYSIQGGYQFCFEKNKINILTVRNIVWLEVSYWLDLDAYDENSQPIMIKKKVIIPSSNHLLPYNNFLDEDELLGNQIELISESNLVRLDEIELEVPESDNTATDVIEPPKINVDIIEISEITNLSIQDKNVEHDPVSIPRTMMEKKLISFAITCMNRLDQIKTTLRKNLRDNIDIISKSEFVLVDFNTPGLEQYIYNNFQEELSIGYLKYYKNTDLKYWHASIAKNISHQMSSGKIVTNLDCDNFIGYRGGLHILKFFEKMGKNLLLHQWSGTPRDGTYGRISCSKQNFLFLGGYDESFLPMGYQDHDFIMRYVMYFRNKNYFSYQYFSSIKPFLKYCQAIKNDKLASLENTNYRDKISWSTMNDINKRKSKNNIRNGIFRVNQVFLKNNVI